jgi:hypothetical protein
MVALRQSDYGVSVFRKPAPLSNRRIAVFIARFAWPSLVVFGDPVIRRDFLQFGPVIRGIQPGFEEC